MGSADGLATTGHKRQNKTNKSLEAIEASNTFRVLGQQVVVLTHVSLFRLRFGVAVVVEGVVEFGAAGQSTFTGDRLS